MKLTNFILPGLFSATVHVGVFTSNIPIQSSQIQLDKGKSAIALNIVSSVRSQPNQASQHKLIEKTASLSKPSPLKSKNNSQNTSKPQVAKKTVVGDNADKGVEAPPVAKGVIKPKYPRTSRMKGEEGIVVFEVEVLASGLTNHIELLNSSGYQRLDRSALKALQKAIFNPGMRGNKPVTSKKRVAFRFNLEEAKK